MVLWPVSIVLGAEVFYFTSALPIAFTVGTSGAVFLVACGVIGSLCGAVAGLIVGLGQRALLPSEVPWRRRWLRVTLLGWFAGGGIYWLLLGGIYLAFQEYPKSGLPIVIGIALQAALVAASGITIGVIQGTAIRPISRAWVRTTVLGWITGASIWTLLNYVSLGIDAYDNEFFRYMLLPVCGAIAGVATGVVMNRLVAPFAAKVLGA